MPRRGKGSLNLLLQEAPWAFDGSYNKRSYKKRKYYNYTHQSVWMRNKPNIVVGSVVGLCCATYYCQWTGAKRTEKGVHALSDLIRRNFIGSAENLREGRWWVLISSSFAHVNLPHLALNMLALWGAGRSIVGVLGVSYFAGLWVVSAMSSSWAQIQWQETQERLRRETVGRRWDRAEHPEVLGIPISRERALVISGGKGALGPHYGGGAGASGAISGLMATLLCLVPKAPTIFLVFPMPLWLGSLFFYTGSAFCMATGNLPMIGHAAHLGGFAAGLFGYWGMARLLLRRTGRL